MMMTGVTLAAIPWLMPILVVVCILISAVLMLVVLAQRPQGGGLSGAFGSGAGGSGQTAFGTKTGDVLTIATVSIFVAFLLVTISLNYVMRAQPAAGGPEAAPTSGAAAETRTDPDEDNIPGVQLPGLEDAPATEEDPPAPIDDEAPTEDAPTTTPEGPGR